MIFQKKNISDVAVCSRELTEKSWICVMSPTVHRRLGTAAVGSASVLQSFPLNSYSVECSF
jgi:hypothetical protein